MFANRSIDKTSEYGVRLIIKTLYWWLQVQHTQKRRLYFSVVGYYCTHVDIKCICRCFGVPFRGCLWKHFCRCVNNVFAETCVDLSMHTSVDTLMKTFTHVCVRVCIKQNEPSTHRERFIHVVVGHIVARLFLPDALVDGLVDVRPHRLLNGFVQISAHKETF